MFSNTDQSTAGLHLHVGKVEHPPIVTYMKPISRAPGNNKVLDIRTFDSGPISSDEWTNSAINSDQDAWDDSAILSIFDAAIKSHRTKNVKGNVS